MTKECKRCYEVGKLKVGQKLGHVSQIGQLLLQGGAIITKVVQYRRQMRQTEEGNRFWQLTPLFTPELLSDRHFTARHS